jgi:hypothetical protein
MTSLERRTGAVFSLCLLLLGPAWGGESAARGGTISGMVVDATADCSAQKCASLARCQSDEEAKRILLEILGERPAPGAVVTARNGRVSREVVCDSKGKFTFTGLPAGSYSVTAFAPPSSAGLAETRKASLPKSVECAGGIGSALQELVTPSGRTAIRLALQDLITVSGRITDSQGRPVAGVRVTGTAVPTAEVGLPDTRVAISNAQGLYELVGFEPLNVYRVAGYLNGGSLDAPGALSTQVEIRVEAKRLRQKTSAPKVPLLTETQLVPARRLWQAFSGLAAARGHGDGWKEMQSRPLPASRGSVITGVDIVLDRVPTDEGQ